MARGAAARRYAKALFQIAKERDAVASLRGELNALGNLLAESSELSDVLLQPIHPSKQRRAVLAAVADKLEASEILKSFYAFLIEQRRLVDFDVVVAEFDRLAEAEQGVTRAQVRTASPLTDDQRARLQQALASRTGGAVELEVAIDESLLGGLIAQVGDTVYDGSLKSQLEQLRAGIGRG